MTHREKGVVLFTVIILLATLTMLILTLMQNVFLYIKASNQLANAHQVFYQLEAAANQLQSLELSTVDRECIVHGKTANEVIEILQRSHGCEWVMENQTYIYLFDDLGGYPCLQIKSEHGLWGSYHWLISIITKVPPRELLQLRVAWRADLNACEQGATMIRQGALSWRHLRNL